MLKSLDLILCQWPLVRDLESVIGTIANFLGPSRSLSLSTACTFGSTDLLDWIWVTSCVSSSDRPPGWSLTKYLRSDVHYYRWQFSMSLEVAAGRGDLAVVKWLFKHFEGCEAPSSVVDLAARNGHLHVLQFLLPFRAQDGEKLLENVVHWEEDVILKAAENGHVEVVRWLYHNTLHEVREDQRIRLIEQALRNGDYDLADQLLPSNGQIVLDYDRLSPGPDLIEWMMELGYFRRDEHAAASAVRDLADARRIELMQQILLLHSPMLDDRDWLEYWDEALEKVCMCGDLLVLEWLMDHPLGRICKGMRYMGNLLVVAAQEGHIHVMRYLHDQGATDYRGKAMISAARQGHTDVVQWLLEIFSYTTQIHHAIRAAARHGHVKILSILHMLNSEKAEQSKRERYNNFMENSLEEDIMNIAATAGHLNVLKWLYLNRALKSSQQAIASAAAHGHLDVVKWLHIQSQLSSCKTMYKAASARHLDAVQRLRSERCMSKAMDCAARGGHLEVVKWIHANRTERCTNMAIKNVVTEGHVGVAYWLITHISDLSPEELTLQDVNIVRFVRNNFEMLLFLHEHFPHVLKHNSEKILRASPRTDAKADPRQHVTNWLEEEYSIYLEDFTDEDNSEESM